MRWKATLANRWPLLVVWLLVAAALLPRLYRIGDYTTFQGDQGVDALTARHLLVEHQLPMEGPATSAGGVHLGPAYYYLLALPMLVDWLDPVADAVLMAFLGAAATGLVFLLARRWFGVWPALAAAGLMAISPAAILDSRSAWNPAPAPVFTCLALLGLDHARRTARGRWLLLVGAALGCLIQFHYFALGIVLVTMVFAAAMVRTQRTNMAAWAIGGMGVFVLVLSPLLVRELAAGLPNTRAALALASGGQPGLAQMTVPRRVYEVFALGFVGRFLAANVEPLAAGLAGLLTLGPAVTLIHRPRRQWPVLLVASLVVATVAQGVLYRGPIFEHYFVPATPILFLAVAAALGAVPRPLVARAATAVVIGALAGLSLVNSPVRDPPLEQVAHTRAVAEAIAAASAGHAFELWLLAAGESDGPYRFWLERMGLSPVPAEGPLAPQLFIVCRKSVCDAAHAQEQAGEAWAAARVAWRQAMFDDEVLHLVQPG